MTTPSQLVQTARDNGMCVGYIVGVSDQAINDEALSTTLSDHTRRYYCLPAEAHSEQLVLVVKKYLQDHPAKLHLPAGAVTLSALVEAFPCS